MKKRFIALLLCCVMIFTLSPSLIASAAADDETVQQVEQTSEAKDTDQQPEQQTDQAQNEDKNETQATEEPKTEEPKTEEPKTEEPMPEEPKIEEPKAEEPKAEDETTIPAAEQSDVPVESEIITPTVNFTNVAPFLPPVSGGVRMLRASSFAAPRAAANFAANDTATDNGMKISKTAKANGDGSYTITLEAYATGEKVITEVTEDVPTDIVLVLDQSGSMAYPIGAVSFEPYEDETGRWGTTFHTRNRDHYENRHNGGNANLWHEVDGKYYSVSVTKTPTYTELSSSTNNYNYYRNANNLYEKVGNEYKKVDLTLSRSMFDTTYTYTFSDGTSVSSVGWNTVPELGSRAPLYTPAADNNDTVYTYTYTDADGVTQTIGTSIGAEKVFDTTLYERVVNTNAGDIRLDALKTAVTAFANNVATKAAGADGELGTDDDVNHRIAVVGYASRADSNDPWINTELFIGANQHNYNKDAKNYYNQALQNMNTPQGQSNIQDSIGALGADGATYTDYGMEMANGILDAYPLTNNEQRNRVIILFTDGFPGRNTSDFNTEAANTAISHANTAKGKGTTVYTVGIFSGADATSAGNMDGDNTQKANWFMQRVSSNNGTPRTPSYYLSAGDSASLNSIFQQISSNIETGGSSSTLTSEAVVKDIIAPQFTLPEGATAANITLETYRCTGKDSAGNYTWSKNDDAMGASPSIGSTDESNDTTKNNQVSVTGFNFSENWVGTETNADGTIKYRGNKLVIKFTVKPRPGFLGGNSVITNTNAGVYENSTAVTPVLTFDQPKVDVTIGNISVSNVESNVYLGGYYSVSVPAEQIKTQMTATCGGVTLDLKQENFGLEEWQNEYVNIVVTVKDAGGNDLTGGIESLTEDVAYTVTITVTPKTETGSATEKTGSGTDTIHVFKPELTFKDGEVYYGDTVPTAFEGNLTNTRWVHYNANGAIDKVAGAEGVSMLNSQPTLTLTYTPDSTKIADGKINTKQDVPVAATVKIGTENVNEHTTFVHQDCTGKTCTLPAGAEFLLHVNTCQLTITKTGGNAKEPYVFTVFKDNEKYSEVTVMGGGSETICELPVGTYTIQEDTGWSWRFTPTIGGGVTLSKDKASNTITCTNTKANDYWLNGFSNVEKNIFGVKH